MKYTIGRRFCLGAVAAGVSLVSFAADLRLPERFIADYVQVEYLRSSGTQYVKTGVTLDSSSRAEIQFTMADALPTGAAIDFATPFGARDGSCQFCAIGAKTANLWYLRHGTKSITTTAGRPSFAGEHTFALNETSYAVDAWTNTFAAESFQSLEAFAFAVNMSGSADQFAVMDLHSLKIYAGDRLVRDFIPCLHVEGQARTPGLLDIADHSDEPGYNPFYVNAGEGEFVAGSPVAALFIAPIADQAYDGLTPCRPPLSITTENGDPVDPADCQVTYANNDEIGVATVTVMGEGRRGSAKFSVVAAEQGRFKIASLGETTYSGVPVRPTVAMTLDGSPVSADDYTVTLRNNDAVGKTCTLVVTGRDGTACAGLAAVAGFVIRFGFERLGGYEPVDYIYGDGVSAWYETDYVPQPQTDRIVLDATLPELNANLGLWCSRDATDSQHLKAYMPLYVHGTGLQFLYDVGQTRPQSTALAGLTRYSFELYRNQLQWTLDGVPYTLTATGNPNFLTAGGAVDLSAIYSVHSDATRSAYSSQKIHSFRVYRDGVLIHNCLPVRDANGEAFLYDTCENPMRLVKHGTFTAGAECRRGLVQPIPVQHYVGEREYHPSVTVTDAATGEDVSSSFDLAYSDNTAPGLGRATLTGKAGTAFEGQRTDMMFKLVPIFCVSADAVSGASGASWSEPMRLDEALASVLVTGGEIWLKTGTYALMASPTEDTQLRPQGELVVRGGFAGTESQPEERPASGLSTIDGQGRFAMLWVTSSVSLSFERLRFVGALSYVLRKLGSGDVSFERCELVGNKYSGNSGVRKDTSKASAFSSYAVENMGGLIQAAGVPAATRFSVKDCVFGGNEMNGSSGFANGGVVGLANIREAVFENCLFATNGMAAGGGQGLAFAGYDVTARFSGCAFRGNVAHSSRATLVSVFGEKPCTLENCLFAGNDVSGDGSDSSGRGLFYTWKVTPSPALKHSLVNCTFAYNIGSRYIGAVSFSSGSNTVKNCIFFANVRAKCANQKPGADVFAESSATAAGSGIAYADVKIDHTLFAEEGNACYWNDPTLAYGSLTTTNCVFADPKFVTTRAEFKNLFGVSGTLSDVTATFPGGEKAMTLDCHLRPRSRAIDAGDPASDWSNEPKPNGKRINLGAYGNTPEAAKTASGTVLILR